MFGSRTTSTTALRNLTRTANSCGSWGKKATSGEFEHPQGLRFDSQGDLFVADDGNNWRSDSVPIWNTGGNGEVSGPELVNLTGLPESPLVPKGISMSSIPKITGSKILARRPLPFLRSSYKALFPKPKARPIWNVFIFFRAH